MKAVWYDEQGHAGEILQRGELPTPEAQAGEVRVRLEASGVNPADCLRRQGLGYSQEFPRIIPNSDGAGSIDQVGAGVPETWLGKRVWLYNGQRFRAYGTAAEYIALSADLVAELPAHVDFEAGATLGIPCMTAHRGVFLAGSVQGQTLLVTGGAGAVGHYAIQLAKWAGATVITTVSTPKKAAHALAAGADHILNYRSDDVLKSVMELTGGAGVDHIVDVDFGGNLSVSLQAVKLNGTIAFYASRGASAPSISAGALIRRNISIFAIGLPGSPLAARQRAQRDIGRWLMAKRGLLTISERFSLDDTAIAHEAVERGDKLGTVVVKLNDG